MATVSKTWVFAADAEGLADEALTANLIAAWSAADGNPAGSLEWTSSGAFTTASEAARKVATTDTWQTLFGVPAGATVTDVQVTGWDELRWGNTNVTSRRVRFRLVGSGGATVHSAGELVDTTAVSAPADGGLVHAMGAGTSRAVDAGSQPAATAVRLEVAFDIVGTATPNVDYEQDNIAITVTYTAAVTTSPVVPVRIPNPRVGPMALRRRARRILMFPGLPGATQQTLTVGGAVTPTGALVRQAQKPLAGAATPAGALTAAGTLVKQTAKILTGGATPAGTVVRQTLKTLAGAATPTGTLVKAVAKFLTGTLSSAGTLLAQSVKLIALSGGVTPTGTLSKRTSKILGGAATPAGTLARATAKILAGTITATGSIVKQTAKRLSGTVTAAGTLVIRSVKLLTLSGGITPTGSLTRQTLKQLAGAVTPTGTLRRATARFFTGAVVPAGLLAKRIGKNLAGTLIAAGAIVVQGAATAFLAITTRTRSAPGSGATRAAGGTSRTRSNPGDGTTRAAAHDAGATDVDGTDGDTRSDLGGS